MTFVCGFDFGTSNTTLSVVHPTDGIRLIPLEGTHTTIPSAIFFGHDGTPPCFGRAALAAYTAREEGRFMRSFKRTLGTSLMSEGTMIGAQRVHFDDIIGHFVRYIKHSAENETGASLDHVVVGRPVHFVDGSDETDARAQSQLEHIFRKSGFKDIRFQFEPIAAAFSHEVRLDAREHKAMVMDIGGGTSDFSVIKLSQRYIQKTDRSDDILGNAGVRIGGNDFDRKLSLKEFMPLLGFGSKMATKNLDFPTSPFFDLSEWSKIQFMYTPKYKRQLLEFARDALAAKKIDRLVRMVEHEQGHLLLGHVEATKINLSSSDQTQVDLSFIETDLALTVTRESFESAIYDECDKIRTYTQDCLHQADIKGSQIDLVILTGGGTGIPLIQALAKEIFPNARISNENMLSSVGEGLGYDARRLFVF